MTPLSLRNIKNRSARLSWLPGASCLVTLDPQKLDAGKKLFSILHKEALLSVDNENGHVLKVRILQHHIFDPSLASIFLEYVLDIQLYTQLRMHGLLTGRQKKQQEFAASIIQECLTTDLLKELAGWDLTLSGRLETKLYGDPVILFQLYYGEILISDIALDGWSGLILVNGCPTSFSFPKAFSEAEDFRTIAIREAYRYLEAATT